MNAAVRAFTRAALFHGHTVLGISDGFDGLMRNQVGYILYKIIIITFLSVLLIFPEQTVWVQYIYIYNA